MEFSEETEKVLIIGSGAAGVRAAIELHDNGIEPLVIGKCRVGDAHTIMATGGINAALGIMDPQDSSQLHAADTLREGQFIGVQKAVETLATEAPNAVMELDRWGMPFNKDANGKIIQRFFGAAVYRRACFAADYTGREMLLTLIKQAEKRRIRFRESVYITKIIVSGGGVKGAFGIDFISGKAVFFPCPAIVIATGGHTSVYRRASTRAFENLGDGMAMAYQAGARLMDMEMVQFHPTGMVWPGEAEGLLVTESVRGEGGILLNAKGERFMERYDRERMELSARDVVARAVYNEIKEGRGTPRHAVYLDITGRPKEYILERLPKVHEQFMRYNRIDVSRERMEVAPTAHYAMGGISVEHGTGETGIKGLFAVGEATGGLHGANRLGGNSLAETVVFGRLVGKHVSGFVSKSSSKSADGNIVDRAAQEMDGMLKQDGTEPEKVKAMVKGVMWKCAGVVRTRKGMEEGVRELERLVKIPVACGGPIRGNIRLVHLLDLKSMIDVCRLILESALMREESRGAHYRSDFPETVREWRANIICSSAKGRLAMIKAAVPDITGEMAEVLKTAPEYSHRKGGYSPE